MLTYSSAFAAMFFGLILFLVRAWEWTILQAGFAIAPGPLLAALLAPRFGRLAGQIGQRPLVIAGGILFAASGVFFAVVLDDDGSYLTSIVVPLALVAFSVPLVFPQVTSAAAQALPQNRTGVGGATTQAIRQFGGSLGVAVTIALVGEVGEIDEVLAGFDRVWWFLIAGGIATTLAALPLKTAPTS